MGRWTLTVAALDSLTRAASAAPEQATRVLAKDDAENGLRKVIQQLTEKGYDAEAISSFLEAEVGLKIAASTVAAFWKRPGKARSPARKKGGQQGKSNGSEGPAVVGLAHANTGHRQEL